MTGESSIRRLAPDTCPQCQAERSFAILRDMIQCRRCGLILTREGEPFASTEPDSPPAEAPEDPRRHLKPAGRLRHVGEINRWAQAAFHTAQMHVRRHEWDQAVEALERSLENQRDFVDAHYWLALLLDDPEQKRAHLLAVLAVQPDHAEAARELLVLKGDLTREQAQALDDPYLMPEMRQAGGAVAIDTENLRCSVCGSNRMTVDEVSGQVVCDSCGSVERRQTADRGVSSLMSALLKRRAQPVQWQVGEHLLVCESCGAQRTIPARRLANECPFCDSKHVIERDALDSFQQPDGLVPFHVSEDEARQRITEKLGGWRERVRGIFDNNTVQQMRIEGVFLPYWMFDAQVEVRQSIMRSMPVYSRDDRGFASQRRPGYESFTNPDAMHDAGVCAVKSPSRLLTNKLGRFDLETMKPYAPELLAKHSAGLYSIDFDEASLLAREQISTHMRHKYRYSTGVESGAQVNVSTTYKAMTFQLVLMPVWVARLLEADGEIRAALVNGQNGTVALGKARKPKPGS